MRVETGTGAARTIDALSRAAVMAVTVGAIVDCDGGIRI